MIDDPQSTSNGKVQGNLIGTSKTATSALGNSDNGVSIAASNTTVGSSPSTRAPTSRNTIAYNGDHGVLVGIESELWATEATGNRILYNSIHSNGGFGIDLVGGSEDSAGNTMNYPKDPDWGQNNLQNKPKVTSATISNSKTTIKGGLNSTPNESFRIQFFSSPSIFLDPSGGDEGKAFVGEKTITTNASGNATVTLVLAEEVLKGHNITSTATADATCNTSEFSSPVLVWQTRWG